jgi:hypothetical protein
LTRSPKVWTSYLLPIHGLQRLEKLMDEYVGGISTLSRYDRNTGKWAMEKAPVHHIID